MNKENTIVPKLRFPEFVNEGEWQIRSFDELFEIGNGRDYKHLDKGEIPVYGSGGYMLSVNDYLYDGESVCIGRKGTIDKPMFLSGKFWTVDTLFYTHSFKDCLPKYIHYVFQNIDWLKHNEAGGVPSLSKTNIYKIETLVPKPAEQQKIASCLSSLDELIAAHTNKLEALKDHKKGLMQQLFPAEGETLPKLRFKEFEKDGEWIETILGEVSKFVRGPFGGALKKEIFVSKGYAVYEQSHAIYNVFDEFRYFVNEDKYKEMKRFAIKAGDIIMSCSGTMGKFAIIPENFKLGVINQALLKLTVKKEYSIDFIKSILELPINQEQILSQAGGGAIKNVASVSILQEIKIKIPLIEEQAKITSCMSSIDDEITAQTQKIETFKEHKKGLMQGLFPVINE